MANDNQMPVWHLKPGQRIERKALQAEFGGRTQGGIGPSKGSPNVFLFTDPVTGEKHGYIDGWQGDGCFHYTGEGQFGDQQMKSGNGSILNHVQEGRALRLFQGARGTVQYIGEFDVDPVRPYYTTDAPESGGGPLRSVIVFRLRPKDIPPQEGGRRLILPPEDRVDEVAVEQQHTERVFTDPQREPYEAERREATLVLAFRDYWRSQGHETFRHRVTPAGEAKPLFTDLFVRDLGLLVEAKGTVERNAIRLAIGQLFDYRRFVPATACAVLVPSKPRQDLVELILGCGFRIYWPEERTFVCLSPPSQQVKAA